MTRTADAVVIGGGIAGLQAARELATAGLRVTLLEARDRLGGRIYTHTHAHYPVELGAEFIHGRPEAILSLASEAELRVAPVEGRFINRSGGQWVEDGETWSEVNRILNEMPLDAPDQTFQNYLGHLEASDAAKYHTLGFVEGYHAADPEKVSVHWLIRTIRAEAETGETSFRLVDGYASLVRALEDRLDRNRCDIRLQTPVKELRWERCQVRITAGSDEFLAARAVLTVPLNVLKSNGIRILPKLEEKETSMQRLDIGPVVRVSLCFREKFWEAQDQLRNVSFLFTDDPDFPTWWTSNPLPYPILTAWATGRHAASLGWLPERQVVKRALESLGRILEKRGDDLAGLLETAFTHDWQGDVFALGAYSYAVVGGADSAKTLAAPVEETLFFAGEATDSQGFNGTVHGAMASGLRAAEELAAAAGGLLPRTG